MTTEQIIALILAGIQGVAQVIAWIKSQQGISDEQKAAQVQQLIAANDALYESLKSQLMLPPTPPPIAVVIPVPR